MTKYEFLQALGKRAAQIVQLDVGQCGDIMPPTGPTLGVEFDEAVLNAHLVE